MIAGVGLALLLLTVLCFAYSEAAKLSFGAIWLTTAVTVIAGLALVVLAVVLQRHCVPDWLPGSNGNPCWKGEPNLLSKFSKFGAPLVGGALPLLIVWAATQRWLIKQI